MANYITSKQHDASNATREFYTMITISSKKTIIYGQKVTNSVRLNNFDQIKLNSSIGLYYFHLLHFQPSKDTPPQKNTPSM